MTLSHAAAARVATIAAKQGKPAILRLAVAMLGTQSAEAWMRTGAYGTASGGGGSWITFAQFGFSNIHRFGDHFLVYRVNSQINFPAPVHVKGFNAYGAQVRKLLTKQDSKNSQKVRSAFNQVAHHADTG